MIYSSNYEYLSMYPDELAEVCLACEPARIAELAAGYSSYPHINALIELISEDDFDRLVNGELVESKAVNRLIVELAKIERAH